MKVWHIVAAGVAVVAGVYLYRSTGGGFTRVTAIPFVSTGPAVESRRGVGHFVGATPLVAAGPATETKAGRGHF